MNLYKVTLYPNVEEYRTTVEAKNVEEAIECAEEEAAQNCIFTGKLKYKQSYLL